MTDVALPGTDAIGYSPPPAPCGLRLWPAVAIVTTVWLLAKLPGWLAPGTFFQFFGLFYAPMLGAIAILIWWMSASRAAWHDRFIVLGAFIVAGAATALLSHPTVYIALNVIALPIVITAWVAWLVITPTLAWPRRRTGLIVVIALAWGAFTLLRLEGLSGDLSADLVFRWSGTAEQRFLAGKVAPKLAATTTATTLTLSTNDWPAFRGPHRDGRVTGERVRTNWAERPPRQVWRHLIGPGWGSFAVVGDRLFTQEQRGEFETVVCYSAATGDELWTHQDNVRFVETISGAGPRATPTFDNGRLYALGAKGRLNCVNPVTGAVIWSRDAAAESGAKLPAWGFSASPLVVDGLVTVITGGPDKAVVAYNAVTGDHAWSAGNGFSYASTHFARLDGVDQLLLVTANGAAGLDPTHGNILWQHQWPLPSNANRVTQPTIVTDHDFLVGGYFGSGTRRISVTRNGDVWHDKEVWTSGQIKPYYNDMVVHDGHAYGFDGNVFTCIALDTGQRRWRASGYGNGQVLLLADQPMLLILSEKGEVALVQPAPDARHEVARMQAIQGKTWNHPVVSRGRLYVRNGEEAACYEVAE